MIDILPSIAPDKPEQGQIAAGAHHFPIRVYYEDTDVGGIVYHASYLRFAERARTEMLRCLGFAHNELIEKHGVMIIVSRLEIDYLFPARLDDRLEIRTHMTAIGGASIKMSQLIVVFGENRPVTECARIKLRLACVTPEGRPARLPAAFVKGSIVLNEENGNN